MMRVAIGTAFRNVGTASDRHYPVFTHGDAHYVSITTGRN
jgi:hypothetical protein